MLFKPGTAAPPKSRPEKIGGLWQFVGCPAECGEGSPPAMAASQLIFCDWMLKPNSVEPPAEPVSCCNW